ncbi:hypothetical protein ATE72_06520 [Sphingopyxis sp. HXXIV]|nr:hypothetical protein ATE72_06520 [Sphingopyxis sp. HXXIV]
MLLLFATFFLVALLLLVWVLVSHFLSPTAAPGEGHDPRSTRRKRRVLPAGGLLSPGRGVAATNVISLRQLLRR